MPVDRTGSKVNLSFSSCRLRAHRLICIFLLIFSTGANAMINFRLYNKERVPVAGAKFEVNGKRAVSQEKGIYSFDSLPQPPYQICISAKGYLPVQYTGVQFLPSEIYLLRQGEDFYYNGGVKVPCVNARHLLIVTMTEKDSAGNTLQPEQAQRLLGEIAKAGHMKIIASYREKLAGQVIPKGETRPVQWDYTYLVGLENGKPFAADSPELAALRTNKSVRFAGPVLASDKEYLSVVSYKPQVTVTFLENITPAQAVSTLDSLGYGQVVTNDVGGHYSYTVVLPPAAGMGMNDVVEKLNRAPGVRNVQPALWRIK